MESFEERSTLRSWLYRIATNRCLNTLRYSGTTRDGGRVGIHPGAHRLRRGAAARALSDALLEGIAGGAAGPEARDETREAECSRSSPRFIASRPASAPCSRFDAPGFSN